MKAIVIFFLLVSLAQAAQPTFTIPEGTTTYGPISINTLHRFTNVVIELAPSFTDPVVQASVLLEVSFDKGATYPHYCGHTFQGRTFVSQLTGVNCPIPAGATNIKATATVSGGVVTVSKTPSLGSK